jgi:salicylate hydroxylase
MSLEVGVVGAGIAGLAAAIALARAGHAVEVWERSQFRNETGAAIVIGPNGTKILRRWGFDFERAGALDYSQMRRIRADTVEVESEEVFTDIVERYGDRWLLFHRADLHAGLKQIFSNMQRQQQQEQEQHQQLAGGGGGAAKLNLGVSVDDVDVDAGILSLSTGESVRKDLVVVADGAHSRLVDKVVGRPCPVTKSPMSMYRFLQPFPKVLADPQAGRFFQGQPSGFTTFYKTEVGRPGLLLNTYPCRGGELLYAALVHPTKPKEKGLEGWDSPADYEEVIADARGFHPAVQAICEGATDVKVYTQMWRDPVEHLVRGRSVLVGDAGHLMLPTHGQGASMALEDAAAMEVLFAHFRKEGDPDMVASLLQSFETLRLPRVAAVQTMSNRMMGPPDKMIAEVRRHYDGPIPGPKAKTFSDEYNDFFFLYDVAEEAKKLV